MKSSLTYLKNHLVCFGVAVLLTLSISAAKAQILLTINDSNASDVVITATGSFAILPGADTSVSDLINNGVDLLQFLPNNFTLTTNGLLVTSSSLTSGNLTDSGVTYDSYATDAITSPGDPDLTLYSTNMSDSEVFTTTSTSFTGTLAVDLSSYGALPTTNSTGTIVLGFSGDTGTSGNPVIGYWKVDNAAPVTAPEPATWSLLFGGLLVIAVGRSLRKQCHRSA